MTDLIRVFISSTSQDLNPYRAAVIETLRDRQGIFIVCMEDFSASASPPRVLDATRLADCQLYVGIIGPRLPAFGISRISGRVPPGGRPRRPDRAAGGRRRGQMVAGGDPAPGRAGRAFCRPGDGPSRDRTRRLADPCRCGYRHGGRTVTAAQVRRSAAMADHDPLVGRAGTTGRQLGRHRRPGRCRLPVARSRRP